MDYTELIVELLSEDMTYLECKAADAIEALQARVKELEGQNSELRVCISDVLATGAFSENAQLRFKRLLGADHPVPFKTLQGVNDERL